MFFVTDNNIELKNNLRNIVENNYDLPKEITDYDAVQLVMQALGSTDGELRDDLGYSILSHWLLEKRILSSQELKEILFKSVSETMLFSGIGEKDGNSVFLRTFSSLLIALILMRNNQDCFLEEKDIKKVIQKVVSYCEQEMDFRGYVIGKGWAHAAAHIADVIDELAQNRFVLASECDMLWKGLISIFNHAQHVFNAEEDERIATGIVTMIEKGKITIDTVCNWITELGQPIDDNLRNQKNNIKHFIRSLYIRLKNKQLGEDVEALLGLEKVYNPFVK